MSNKNLSKAKKAKNDEFYTLYSDVEKEVVHYKDHLKGKVVYCNCDDPEKSNFWKYFKDNFDSLRLKKLVSTYYSDTQRVYKTTYNGKDTLKRVMRTNGDFRSPEAIDILKESDIVVTNPPFSLFREYVAQLIEYKKDFLIIGSLNAISYKEIFPLLKEGNMWLGNNSGSFKFIVPEDYNKGNITYGEDGTKYASLGNILWFTNLDHSKRHEKIILYKDYIEDEYPKYYDYDGIEVSRVAQIPKDYYGIMGVPITFLTKHNPEQFEIIDCCEPCIDLELFKRKKGFKEYKSRQVQKEGVLCQKTYHRLLIKRKES